MINRENPLVFLFKNLAELADKKNSKEILNCLISLVSNYILIISKIYNSQYGFYSFVDNYNSHGTSSQYFYMWNEFQKSSNIIKLYTANVLLQVTLQTSGKLFIKLLFLLFFNSSFSKYF